MALYTAADLKSASISIEIEPVSGRQVSYAAWLQHAALYPGVWAAEGFSALPSIPDYVRGVRGFGGSDC